MYFETVAPEEVGVSSEKVLDFIKMLDDSHMRIHSILMAKGNKIFAECHHAPVHKDFLHRMYSVSKSFVAMAVGLAVTEGILGMDDSILSYFPEFQNEHTDEYFKECTVRDMLTMRSNINVPVSWWGKYGSRAEAYYAQKTGQIPGTLYYYDSVGSFLLGCIVEKLTGKPFLEYLKEKVLLEMGFSKESYTLYEPGGFTVGDSGVMCTAKDLLIFARLIMNKGQWQGKQFIDRAFMEQAISRLSNNNIYGSHDSWRTGGYGYLIWKTHPDGFSLVGMGDQLAICDKKRDVAIVITADNQGDDAARHIIFHELYRHFLPKIQDTPLPGNPAALQKLRAYLSTCKLVCQQGEAESPMAARVNHKTYTAMENDLGLSFFRLDLGEKDGVFTFRKDGTSYEAPFGIGENKEIEFGIGKRPRKDAMGFMEDGLYTCYASAAWTEENTFCIKIQVLDTYFGCLNIHISFKDSRATLFLQKSGQYVFENTEGYAIAKSE